MNATEIQQRLTKWFPGHIGRQLTTIFSGLLSGSTYANATLTTPTADTLTVTNQVVFGAGATLDADSGTVTLSSNAGTLSKMAGVITTESLTTAAGASQALTITNTLVASTDLILLSRGGGSNSAGSPLMRVVPGTGSFVVTLDNVHASAAFNGTFKIAYLVLKA